MLVTGTEGNDLNELWLIALRSHTEIGIISNCWSALMSLLNNHKNPEPDTYFETVPASEVREDEMTAVRVGNRKVLLTRHRGGLYAVDTQCPHAAADLSKGSLRTWQLCCHEHDYCFDIRNGRIVWPEDEVYRLKRYEVKEEDGRVFVRLMPVK